MSFLNVFTLLLFKGQEILVYTKGWSSKIITKNKGEVFPTTMGWLFYSGIQVDGALI